MPKKSLKHQSQSPANNTYVYRSYYANRKRPEEPKIAKSKLGRKLILAGVVVIVAVFVISLLHSPKSPVATKISAKAKTTASLKVATPTVAQPNMCANNLTGSLLILVSISKRHLWACQGTVQKYDSAVVTGYQGDPADVTPLGTYHIYAKETDRHLIGSDSNGSWDDYVNYWMPFLDNQYGAYGLHDATWRPANAFGNIDPSSSNASHGCVELPLQTAQWIYNWASVGTAVTIEA